MEELSILELQARMTSGETTARSLAEHYLARTEQLDRRGPALNAVIETNPDALRIAAALDEERRTRGPRGPLHGVPVMLKDNIDTADAMTTTAGSLALEGSRPQRDAFVAKKLRQAGAVILGKTNPSEWANFRSTRSSIKANPTMGVDVAGKMRRSTRNRLNRTKGASLTPIGKPNLPWWKH